MKSASFHSEAELCDAFSEAVRRDGWDVYPECGGWDLLLVWNGKGRTDDLRVIYNEDRVEGVAVGYQIGIDAKLRANVDVLAQCSDRFDVWARSGDISAPHEAAVLVPAASGEFQVVARRLGLRVFTDANILGAAHPKVLGYRHHRNPVVAQTPKRGHVGVKLPPVALIGSGGTPSPRALTRWRVEALRLCILLRSRGHITSADFKAHNVSPSRWTTMGWIEGSGKIGRLTKYVIGPRFSEGPEHGYEAERDAIAAKDADGRAA